jgi:hypothetical protein
LTDPVDGRRLATERLEAHPLKKFAVLVSFIGVPVGSAVLPSVAIAWVPRGRRPSIRGPGLSPKDFPLIRVDPVDVAEANPSIPGLGGPTGVG